MRLSRTKEEVLLLLIAVVAAVAAIASVKAASPASPGLWGATAAAVGLALTCLFAFWFAGAARRRLFDSLFGDWDTTRSVLAAIPEGLLLIRDGEIRSVNRSFCELLGYGRDELLGARAPYAFWPPEHRHELEQWHTDLAADGNAVAELTLRHRLGDRVRVLVSGRRVFDESGTTRYLVTVRDVSESHRRERRLAELSTRDAETGLLDRREFEARLGAAVRRALQSDTNVTVVLAELATDARDRTGVLGRPEALFAIERLRRLVRAGDDFGRTGEVELGWILPETDAAGGLEAVDRWRAELAGVDGITLTAGVCDLADAGDALALYALADRALAAARRDGPGTTVPHVDPGVPPEPAAG